MKIKARQTDRLGRRVRLLLCLCLGLTLYSASSAFPSELSATGTRVTVTQAVSQATVPVLEMTAIASPESLQDFARLTVNKLSANPPFTSWKNASTESYPLGPGTHSWLVNVMNGEQRIGYLIITAKDQGGYMLSEYGAGSYGLPYSLQDLHQFLVQQELISSNLSGKFELTALYAPLLPVWKLTIEDKTLYINASVLQVLPWSLSKAEDILHAKPDAAGAISSLDTGRTPLPVYESGGQDNPYADLLWLSAPPLTPLSSDKFALALASGGSLAFQSPGRNDAFGAPFMITGCQSWGLSAPGTGNSSGSSAIVYAASGPEGKRYLPLAALQDSGTLHTLTSERSSTTLGSAPGAVSPRK
ncbi:hypothetical protein [Paenibacillus jilunlii]|uniref:Uncharacterized protein n=1 Tax=Paenibacillus jilunlii TaxID=682956 RepID=A0A1G9GDS9_9BACL|nr:hypothetical protein [Paenibacillus jilunlii]KWX71442.1 hypothetical protein AML91_24880 [Paenibacillus jilunlii]SDK98735.1 hypothetical protein SAMN05216191_101346 [Paenibacillus jilunlii]